MVYNKDYHAYQFCDGTNWKSMGSAHAFGSGGCSNPAGVEKAIIYNTDFHTYQFCNGTSWAKMQGG